MDFKLAQPESSPAIDTVLAATLIQRMKFASHNDRV